MKTLSERYHQAHKEAKWSCALALAYFVWWYLSAYVIAPEPNSSEAPELYFGFPLWFLLACILGPLIFSLLCALMVRYLFQDMPLDITEDDNEY